MNLPVSELLWWVEEFVKIDDEVKNNANG